MEKPKNKQFIAEYAPYVASKLGQAHGSQKSGQAFLAAVKQNPDTFRESVKVIAKDYLKLATETLGD